ncbi:MarR family winged helix-turn-helix transcriptional regulator [Peribacillus frigoritolerans]|uniref:MarR family winged helix-turn-helix transcriptional regulator n=1 Tax=Peribacillus TaxID=2675229 RepID=UPI0022324033|nr:MarR family winged helix-turn-helix transcriptional regulator [Peribacillus frigoritolerans]MDM5309482.1 MarR family winged helix-turn-helix transcriptional regulator [Peribacillus frigoritolerans]UZD48905.1 MarR family winged helix-turn-helix transcriptional regulator [Peribacillus frigoritolerans]
MENEKQLMRSVQLLRSFWNVQKNIMRFVQKTAAENGLTVPQYSILMTITLYKETSQKNVGEKTFLPKSTLSQAVDGLVRGGLLHREHVEGNRREIQLSITDKGKNLLKTIHFHEGSIHQVFQTAIEMLSEEQFEELLKTHLKITNILEAQATEQGECTK